MQRIFILLSIGVFLTLIHHSNGAPRKVRSLENDELNNMMKKIVQKLKPYVDEDLMDESDEEKKKNMEFLEKSEESNSDSNEEENVRDKQAILSHFIDIDHEKISENNGEK